MAEFQEVMKQKNRMCDYFNDEYDCCSCPLTSSKNGCGKSCVVVLYSNSQQAEEIIMKWAEEHPVQTNADKFKEVFGKEPRGCIFESYDCDCEKCNDCENADFWQQEYREPKGE